MQPLRQLIDRTFTHQVKTLDRMIVELSKYMTSFEIDTCVGFLDTISTSQYDVNWSETDSATQMRIMLGSQRYSEVKWLWSMDNQQLTKQTGRKRYLGPDGKLYDGLDEHDLPELFKEVWV
jgi:hypothetical protein